MGGFTLNRRQQLCWLLIVVLFILSGCGEGVINTQTPNVVIPENFKSAAVGEDFILLNWSPVGGADSYRIYHTTNAFADPFKEGKIIPVESPTVSYRHSLLTANTVYRYVITSIVNNAESAPSLPVLEVSTLGVPPNVPQNVKVEALDQAVKITWLMKKGETYNLYWDTEASITRLSPTTKKIEDVSSPYTHDKDDSDAPLVNGTAYYYLMEAVNEYGTSGATNRNSAKPRGQNAPIAPANFSAEGLNGQVRLTWDSSQGAVSYKIYWSSAATIDINSHPAERTITVTGTEYLHEDLVNNLTFYYVVTAVATETIESNPSEIKSAIPSANAIPTSPFDVKAVPGDGKVMITWRGPATATYTLYWSTEPEVSSKSPNIFTNATSPFTHEPVANDVTYYYVLTATVAGGISRDSELDSAKPYEGAVVRPDPPTNFKAVPGDSLIKLTWDVAVGATRYNIYWSLTPDFIINQQTNVILVGILEHSHLQLSNGVTYYYRLSALNDAGESDHTEEISASPRASTVTGDSLRGGRLYVQWWEENGASQPQTDHVLWEDRAKFIDKYINEKTGAATWSCQTCHGWDYKGASGNSGPMSRDYTGFPGLILAAQNKSIDDISAFIRAGETSGGKSHGFIDVLSEADISDLSLFVKEAVNDPGYSWSGDLTAGESIYTTPIENNAGAGCDASGCHAGDSEAVANVALYDADRFLHIVRFGLPEVMMGGLDLNEAKNVLAYTWKSLVVGNVENNFSIGDLQSFNSTADIASGGSLYDRWWTLIDYDNKAAGGQPPVPQGGHPLWVSPNDIIAGAETWRCKECHGWDYRGVDGQYGAGNHFSGVKGIIATDANPTMKYNGASQLYEFLRSGGEDGLHAYSSLFDDKYIYQLVQFIETIRQEATQGQAPHNLINDQTGEPFSYDIALGKLYYEDNNMGRCARSSCHKKDGKRFPFKDRDPDRGEIQLVDTTAKLNPWEFLHRIRYGFVQASDVRRMKGVIEYIPEEIKTLESSINILAYSQTDLLPNIARGGRLYDTWWKENADEAPVGEHPLWPTSNATQGTETWRCSSCHGWDYKGNQGVLADSGHPLFTDIKGVLDLTMAPESIVDFLLDGTVNNPSDHALNSYMKRQDISDISEFLTNGEQQGVADIQAAIEAGNAQLGQDIYQGITPGNCVNCHGAQGTSISNVDVSQVAKQTPHQLAHTVRFGQPGSLMVPSITRFTGLSPEEAGHVLAFVKTLSGGVVVPPVIEPPPGTSTYSYATANVERGGRLYDTWWMEMQTSDASVQPPSSINPFWDQRDKLNIADPANPAQDTWRCITCHAWNYKGIEFYPTDRDVDNLIYKLQLRQGQMTSPEELQEFIFNWIKNGSREIHNFGSEKSGLPSILGERELWDLTRFIIEGTLDTANFIYRTTGELVPLFVDANNGKSLYEGKKEASVNCLSCHGADGRTLPSGAVQAELDIFAVAKQNPWRFLHKVRFSQPGSSMPAIIGIGVLNDADVRDITGYAQKVFDIRGVLP